LPVFEAAANGLPVIAPNWGGISDYVNIKSRSMIYDLAYEEKRVHQSAVWENVIEPNAVWCHPSIDDLKKQMRTVYYKRPNQLRAKNLKNHIMKNFSEEAFFMDVKNKLNAIKAEEEQNENE